MLELIGVSSDLNDPRRSKRDFNFASIPTRKLPLNHNQSRSHPIFLVIISPHYVHCHQYSSVIHPCALFLADVKLKIPAVIQD